MRVCMIPVTGLFVLFMALITGNVEISTVIDIGWGIIRSLTTGDGE